ncbi:hypothetical protein VP1G_11004 [Cytospora mali]|uniref:Uncharacterized protein n=1 Tax=Cytospora mali TaxID=578113 RepID=A0A194V2I8_CYTMA|nr:hypothetical protein VP1G_11004 [Valsa mali var. pyri (nom. inval.)]
MSGGISQQTGYGDALVDGKPVPDEQHEVLEPGLEHGVSGHRDGDVGGGADERPCEPGHALRAPGEDLERQGDAVDVGAVVGYDAQRQDDEAETPEAA